MTRCDLGENGVLEFDEHGLLILKWFTFLGEGVKSKKRDL